MCTRPITIRVPHNPYERNVLGFQGYKTVTVPCGKCPECLAKRQRDISVRAYREALKYGDCFFVTFTYKPFCVPFSQVFFDVNLDTGESTDYHVPSLVTDSGLLEYLRSKYKLHSRGVFYDYASKREFVQYEDGAIHEHYLLFTPTLSYRDFASRIKYFRTDYQRKVGKLDFKYICVGEYGSKKSCRPHFHCLFFGLNYDQVCYFCKFWDLGFYYIQHVKLKNDDGSDGMAKVASYIGKYAAKGSFVPSSVKNRFTLPCKVSASRKIGLSDLDPLIRYYRAYDICKYDINKFDIPQEKQSVIISEVFNRLKKFEYGVSRRIVCSTPLSIRRAIFGYKVFDGVACWSTLYYKVMDFARSFYQAQNDRTFEKFFSDLSGQGISPPEICFMFENMQDCTRKDREAGQLASLSSFYSKSKFG